MMDPVVIVIDNGRYAADRFTPIIQSEKMSRLGMAEKWIHPGIEKIFSLIIQRGNPGRRHGIHLPGKLYELEKVSCGFDLF